MSDPMGWSEALTGPVAARPPYSREELAFKGNQTFTTPQSILGLVAIYCDAIELGQS